MFSKNFRGKYPQRGPTLRLVFDNQSINQLPEGLEHHTWIKPFSVTKLGQYTCHKNTTIPRSCSVGYAFWYTGVLTRRNLSAFRVLKVKVTF